MISLKLMYKNIAYPDKTFETEELANKWLEERAKLPTIDKNLKEDRMFI